MTRSAPPPESGVPESAVSELQALYREAAQAEPDALLDRKILDAARAGLRGAGEAKARPPPPWWKGWLPAASALAIALVGLSITWRVMDQQERDLRQEMKAAEGVRERSVEAAGGAGRPRGAADAVPLPPAPAPVAEKDRRVQSTTLRDAPSAVPEPAATSAPAAPAPMAPVVADEAAKKSLRSEKEDLRERRDTSAAVGVASSPERQAGKLEAGGPAIGSRGSSGATAAGSLAAPAANPVANSAAKSAAASVVDGASPEAWLKQIRELRAAGRSAEAAESLARFRERYPDFALPDDLLKLK